MNLKLEITQLITKQLNLPSDQKSIRKFQKLWFVNSRTKNKGGMRLTDLGLDYMKKADFKAYSIPFEDPIIWTNDFLVWIDQNLELPFFIDRRKIWVFEEKLAVQLILFDGNLQKFQIAKKYSRLKE